MNSLVRRKGFTLVEVMIVLIVIAVLAAISFPSYNESVRKSRRGQAQADMAELAQNLERWHTVNTTYATYVVPARLQRSPQQGPIYYTIGVVPTANTFAITATPANAHAGDKCGNLSLNQAGTKGVTSESVGACW